MTNDTRSHERALAIVGASGGIGRALSRHLAASGARLALAARDEARLADAAAELDAETTTSALDAADFGAVEAWLSGAKERFGRLDGVVNLAGSLLLKPAHITTAEELDDALTANLRTAFAVVRGAARVMKDGGSVVLMSSCAARTGLARHEAIAAAKAAVEGLARSAAATYAPKGLRVNAVAPGLVRTPLTARITGNESALEASRSMHPLGRIGEPEEVASAIAWLLGDDARWVTGQVFGVDGGMAAVGPSPSRG